MLASFLAQAQEIPTPSLRPAPESDGATAAKPLILNSTRVPIWRSKVGDGFRAGTWQAGVSAGAGFGVRILGSSRPHDLALLDLQLGWICSDVVADRHWWRGNWEMIGQLFGGIQFNGHEAYLAGLTAALRYNFVTGTRWVPFFEGGGGPSLTDISHPDLSTKFEFNLHAAAGAHYFFRDNLAATFEYRFFHLSNAGMDRPNLGVNSNLFFGGLNWFF